MSDIFFCKFKEKLLEFMEELVDLCPEEPDFIFARMLLKNKNEKEIYESFYKKCYPLRELIWKKDSDFFFENSSLFDLSADKSDHFKELYTKSITKQDQDCIWSWLNLFIQFCEKREESERQTMGS